MDLDAVRAYARRPWHVAAAAKQAYWASEPGESTFRASMALFEHMRRVRPDWPGEGERADDLQHHLRMTALLDRTADVIPNH